MAKPLAINVPTNLVYGAYGFVNDLIKVKGLFHTWLWARDGDDVIKDHGGFNDVMALGEGDDRVAYFHRKNEFGLNSYFGDEGTDTLELRFTRKEWMTLNPILQTQIDNALAHMESGSAEPFYITALDIRVVDFEAIDLFIGGKKRNAADDAVTTVDDVLHVGQGDRNWTNVKRNDDIPDLFRSIKLVGNEPDEGEHILRPKGRFAFETFDVFNYLAEGETKEIDYRYRVTDADGDKGFGTITVIVTGSNDGPTMADAAATAFEDGTPVTVDLAALGADIDSDDDGSSLTYDVFLGPNEGSVNIVGTTLTFHPGSDFQDLAVGEERIVQATISATDRHGANTMSTVQFTVNGVNDLPVLGADSILLGENGSVTFQPLDNDSDADTSDVIKLVSATGAAHGTLTLVDGDDADTLPNDAVIYTPDLDYAGTDTFIYTVTDGHGTTVSQSVTATIDPRAQAPDLSYQILSGATANTFTLRVTASQTDADLSEYIDRIELTATDASGAPLANFGSLVSENSVNPTDQPLSLVHDFVFNLPAGSTSEFTVGIEAFTRERSNGDEASGTDSVSFDLNGGAMAFDQNFTSSNQSIWSSGSAFNFNDSYTFGASLSPGGEQAFSLIPPSGDTFRDPVLGIGPSWHFSGLLRSGADFDIGIKNSLGIQGGSVDSTLNYDGNITANFNTTTDQMTIWTTAVKDLPATGFTASSPNISFDVSLVDFDMFVNFAFYVWGYFHFHYAASTAKPINYPDINDGWLFTLPDVGFDLDTFTGGDGFSFLNYDGSTFSYLDGYGSFSSGEGDVTGPHDNEILHYLINSHALTNQSESIDFYWGNVNGSESRNFVTLTFDMDGIAASIKGIPNPVHRTENVGQDPLNITLEAELIDIDVVLPISYRQDNFLAPGALQGVIEFEDGSLQGFTFGDTLTIDNASAKDTNGDGEIAYKVYMTPDAQFQTSAAIDFSLYDSIDMLSFGVNGSLSPYADWGGISVGENGGPYLRLPDGTIFNETISAPIYGTSFALNVDTVDTGTLIV